MNLHHARQSRTPRPAAPAERLSSAGLVRVARPGISVMWTRALSLLMVVLLGLGVVAFSSTLYQRAAFDDTTSQLETELDASVSLVRDLRSVDIPMGSIFYEFGSPTELEEHVRTFSERRRNIDAAFDHAQRVIPVRSDDDPLGSARAAWNTTADEVMAARDLWGTSVVKDALAAGRDPYSEQWAQLRGAQADLTEVTAQSLGALRTRTRAVDRIQRLIPAVVLGALILTLAIGAISARRLSRRIVAPLLNLQCAATRMRDGDLRTTIDVGVAGAELHDLAQAMNELATSLHTSHDQLREQAYTDALTGLPNRTALTEHLLRRDNTGGGQGTALLFIDLDDFKVVNDSLGHEAGDQLLAIVATRLRSSARRSDLVARLGGDEFAVALEHGHDPADAMAVAERTFAALGEPVAVNGTAVTVGCSIGIALSGPGGTTAEELLRNADIAMYMAKSRGKNRLELFAPAMHTEMLARMNLKAGLTHAAELDQLELHYQPVVDLTGDDILGWEALVRWRHPDRGLIPPSEFIPMAEDTGDILSIGRWVLDRACADFARTLGCSGQPGQWVSVNISGRQLLQPDFAETVRRSLHRNGLQPGSLVLEITEATLVTDTAGAADALARLQRDGVRIALDDFGTGFSSLRYLQQLPVDIIKIDRSFVTQSGSAAPTGMLDAIVTLIDTLGLDMIAEGIEQPAELERLKRLGCPAGQGYYISRPMPLAQARTFTLTSPDLGRRDGLAAAARSSSKPPRV